MNSLRDAPGDRRHHSPSKKQARPQGKLPPSLPPPFPDVQHLLQFLHTLKMRNLAAFERIQYVEQPTRRDLSRGRQNAMHVASKLTGLDMLLLARDMGSALRRLMSRHGCARHCKGARP